MFGMVTGRAGATSPFVPKQFFFKKKIKLNADFITYYFLYDITPFLQKVINFHYFSSVLNTAILLILNSAVLI